MGIEKSRLQLIKNEPFFGRILCQCEIKEDKNCPTAGALITKDGKFRIVYNKQFIESFSEKVQTGIWKHEVLHLLFSHKLKGFKNKKRANMAMDMAINSYIGKDNLPEKGIFAEDRGFEKFLTTDQYYNLLGGNEKEETEEEQQYEFDEHQEISEEVAQELKKLLAENAAKEASKGLRAGDIPLDLLKDLDIDIFRTGELNWKMLLKKYANDVLSQTKVGTRNRPNRRVGFSADGTIDDRLPKIFIGIDESGSIDEELLLDFTAEINKLFKDYAGSVELIHWDTEISKIEKFNKSIKQLARYGSGGTDPQPSFDFFDKKKGDLLIQFTDGFFFGPYSCKRGKNVLFLIYDNPSFEPAFGKAIVMKAENKK
jgi:predicted metal-dependent peptidase